MQHENEMSLTYVKLKTQFDETILLDKVNLEKIKEILHELSSDLKDLNKCLTENIHDREYTATHYAVLKGDIQLLELLLDFDAPVDIERNIDGIGMVNSIALANILLEKAPLKYRDNYINIDSLINYRYKWKKNNTAESYLSLSRMLRLFEKMLDGRQIRSPAVILFGGSQAGKSSLFNYLLGTNYEYSPIKESLVPMPDSKNECVPVGNGYGSKTIYPTVCPIFMQHDIPEFEIADMPGSGETRGGETEVCVAASKKLLLHTLVTKQIKGIVFVCNHTILRGQSVILYRVLAEKVARMLKPKNIQTNLFFVVTGFLKGIDDKAIVNIHNNLNNIKANIVKCLENPKLSPKDKDEFLNILWTTEVILSNPQHIIPINITDKGISRQSILAKFNLPCSTSSDEINFDDVDDKEALISMHDLMVAMVMEYYERRKSKFKAENELRESTETIVKNIEGLRNLKNDFEILIAKTVEERALEMAKLEGLITYLEADIKSLETQIQCNDEEIKIKEKSTNLYEIITVSYNVPQGLADGRLLPLNTLPVNRSSYWSLIPRLTSFAPPAFWGRSAVDEQDEKNEADTVNLKEIVNDHGVGFVGAYRIQQIIKTDHRLPKVVGTYKCEPKQQIASFEFTNIKGCSTLLLGKYLPGNEFDGDKFIEFEEVLPVDKIARGQCHVTVFDKIKDCPEYQKMASNGMLQFYFVGMDSDGQGFEFSLKINGYECEKKAIIDRVQLLKTKNTELSIQIDAAKIVLKRMQGQLNILKNHANETKELMGKIETAKLQYNAIASHADKLCLSIQENKRILTLNEAYFKRLQKLVLANVCQHNHVVLDEFAKEKISQPIDTDENIITLYHNAKSSYHLLMLPSSPVNSKEEITVMHKKRDLEVTPELSRKSKRLASKKQQQHSHDNTESLEPNDHTSRNGHVDIPVLPGIAKRMPMFRSNDSYQVIEIDPAPKRSKTGEDSPSV